MDLNPMEITLTDFEINDIKNIIEKKQNCFIKIFPSFNTIWFKDEFDPFGTELRLLCLGNLRITISRVAFKNKRCGTMTEILNRLEQIYKEKKIHKIVFQSVETKEMINFCVKNGYFSNPVCSFEMDGLIFGDYEKEII